MEQEVNSNGSATSLIRLRDKLNLRTWPTIEEFCFQEGVDVAHLPNAVAQRANTIFTNVKEVVITIPQLDTLYQIYHALQAQETLSSELIKLRLDLSSYNSFLNAFHEGEQLGSTEFSYFRQAVTRVYNNAHSQRVLRVQEKPEGSSGLLAKVYKPSIIREKNEISKDVWIEVDRAEFYTTYATPDIIEAVEQAKQNGESFRLGYNHATTSAALDGIGIHGALLSRSELESRGGQAISGEISDITPRVYADAGGLAGGSYWDIRWFNEFPITIEFNKDTKQEQSAPDWGISLGHKVPLQNVARIFCPAENFAEVKRWTARHAPHAQTQSFEAYTLAIRL